MHVKERLYIGTATGGAFLEVCECGGRLQLKIVATGANNTWQMVNVPLPYTDLERLADFFVDVYDVSEEKAHG